MMLPTDPEALKPPASPLESPEPLVVQVMEAKQVSPCGHSESVKLGQGVPHLLLASSQEVPQRALPS